MTDWTVELHERFKIEVLDLPADVRVELLAFWCFFARKVFDWVGPKSIRFQGPSTRI